MTTTSAERAVRLVHSTAEAGGESVWFCGKCAAPSPHNHPPAPNARVCPSCGLGLLLETRSDGRPRPSDAFVIVDAALTVQAVSERAERLLEIAEPDVVHRPVKDLLMPAGSEGSTQDEFIRAIVDAATGSQELSYVVIRPVATFGVRMRARIGSCGPPRAALIVLESPPPRLQSR